MYLFGSFAAATEQSDLDILISFQGISIKDYADNYFALKFAIADHFNRKIDLITEESLRNPYLIESINRTKQLIYAA